jgi:hypothetical protein
VFDTRSSIVEGRAPELRAEYACSAVLTVEASASHADTAADALTLPRLKMTTAARIPRTTTTTSNSISVKPRWSREYLRGARRGSLRVADMDS